MQERFEIYQIPIVKYGPEVGAPLTKQSPFDLLFEVAGITEGLWIDSVLHAQNAAAIVACGLNDSSWGYTTFLFTADGKRLRELIDPSKYDNSIVVRGNDVTRLIALIPGMDTYLDTYWPNRGSTKRGSKTYLFDATILLPTESFLSYHEQAWKKLGNQANAVDRKITTHDEQIELMRHVIRSKIPPHVTVLFHFVGE